MTYDGLKKRANELYQTNDESLILIPFTDKPGQAEPVLDEDSESECTSSTTQHQPKHNTMSLDCILWSEKEAHAVKKYLDKIHKSYIRTEPDGDCFYEAILISLTPPFDPQTGWAYTANDLRLQICSYMLNHPKKCSELLYLRLQAFGTSLYHFILKMMDKDEWGETCLLHIVHEMWELNCTVIDVHQNPPLLHYGGPEHHSLRSADIVIVYNGCNHFTGTGKVFFF